MKIAIVLLMPALCLCALLGCQNKQDEEEAGPVAEVEVESAAPHPIQDTLLAYGTVEYSINHTRALTVQLESQVAEQFVLAGASVKRGQPLLRLTGSAASRLDVDKAARDASVTEAELQRVGRLRDQGLATDSDLRSAKAAAESALQLRESLRERIGVDGMTLRAPIDGVVDAFTAQPGDVLAPGTLLMRIVDPQAVQVRLGFEPEEIPRLKKGQAVTVTPQGSSALSVAGQISEVDARVDPTAHIAGAWVQVADATPLVPGTPIRGRVVLDTHTSSITLPRSAVLYEGRTAYVFTAEGGMAHRKNVTTGLSDDARVEIVKGLAPGERVVVGGNYELQDGMSIRLPGEKVAGQ